MNREEERPEKRAEERPEKRRERLRQEELRHPSSSMQGSNLADLVGGQSRKGTGIILLVFIVIFIILFLIFR